MEKYRKVEKPKAAATESKANEVRVTTLGKLRNYIAYALTLFNEKNEEVVILKAMGSAIVKAVSVAEVLKRRVAGLHQITEIGSTEFTDEWEPLEEGLDPIVTTRRVSSIVISLYAKEPTEEQKKDPGYQVPLPPEEVKPQPEPLVSSSGSQPRSRGGRGRGRGASATATPPAGGEAPPRVDAHPRAEGHRPQRGGRGRGRGRGGPGAPAAATGSVSSTTPPRSETEAERGQNRAGVAGSREERPVVEGAVEGAADAGPGGRKGSRERGARGRGRGRGRGHGRGTRPAPAEGEAAPAPAAESEPAPAPVQTASVAEVAQ